MIGTESAFGRSSHGWQVPATDYDTDTSDVYAANGRKYYSGVYVMKLDFSSRDC